jgi:hypothetical protein
VGLITHFERESKLKASRQRMVEFGLVLVLLSGCQGQSDAPATVALAGGSSDVDKIRAADVSILFVGNSHTSFHNLPGVVADMIRFRQPGKSVYTHIVMAGHLDDAAKDPACRVEIESRPWKFVVLQAQRISVSGKYNYSRTEGIDLATMAKARGATVLFYSEWGLRGKAGDGERNEKIYREMAKEAGVGVAAVNRAWDLALSERPELPLYEPDGNHQSAVGAFLTACVLYARLTNDSPAGLADFPYAAASDGDRRYLADAAARALASGEKD